MGWCELAEAYLRCHALAHDDVLILGLTEYVEVKIAPQMPWQWALGNFDAALLPAGISVREPAGHTGDAGGRANYVSLSQVMELCSSGDNRLMMFIASAAASVVLLPVSAKWTGHPAKMKL